MRNGDTIEGERQNAGRRKNNKSAVTTHTHTEPPTPLPPDHHTYHCVSSSLDFDSMALKLA